MNKMFTQPTGPVAKQTNKQAIARLTGLKQSAVGYLNQIATIDNFLVLFDPESETSWYRGDATGIPSFWAVSGDSLILTTSSGSYTLVKVADQSRTYASSSIPTTGSYTKGDLVHNSSPDIEGSSGSRYVVTGWLRITTGDSHVVNTDWVILKQNTGD